MRIVENSSACLKLRESSAWLAVFLGFCAIMIAVVVIVRHVDHKQLINAFLFAAAAIFFQRDSRISLDKAARRCGIWRRDMWRTSYRTIPFDDIQDVQVEIQRPNTSVLMHSRLSLQTLTGPVPLTAGFRPELDGQIALREAMIDVMFVGRKRPAPLDRIRLLLDAGRPFAAEESA